MKYLHSAVLRDKTSGKRHHASHIISGRVNDEQSSESDENQRSVKKILSMM